MEPPCPYAMAPNSFRPEAIFQLPSLKKLFLTLRVGKTGGPSSVSVMVGCSGFAAAFAPCTSPGAPQTHTLAVVACQVFFMLYKGLLRCGCGQVLPRRGLLRAPGPWRSMVSSTRDAAEPAPDPAPTAQRHLKVAIVGRPNVGKSTLFNRLTGGRGRGWDGGSALVTPIPGTTRDRKDGKCNFGGISMMITDTGGLEEDDEEGEELQGPVDMRSLVNGQVAEAVRAADVVLFIVDARAGVSPEDTHFARWIYKLVRWWRDTVGWGL